MDTLEKQVETQQISSGDLNREINAVYAALDKDRQVKNYLPKMPLCGKMIPHK